jgi:hypothetical protein
MRAIVVAGRGVSHGCPATHFHSRSVVCCCYWHSTAVTERVLEIEGTVIRSCCSSCGCCCVGGLKRSPSEKFSDTTLMIALYRYFVARRNITERSPAPHFLPRWFIGLFGFGYIDKGIVEGVVLLFVAASLARGKRPPPGHPPSVVVAATDATTQGKRIYGGISRPRNRRG